MPNCLFCQSNLTFLRSGGYPHYNDELYGCYNHLNNRINYVFKNNNVYSAIYNVYVDKHSFYEYCFSLNKNLPQTSIRLFSLPDNTQDLIFNKNIMLLIPPENLLNKISILTSFQ